MHIRVCSKGGANLSDGQQRRAKMPDRLSVPVWFELSKAGKQRAAEGITVAHAATASQHAEIQEGSAKCPVAAASGPATVASA
jgi:ferredoxin